jgi:hypothetical protein
MKSLKSLAVLTLLAAPLAPALAATSNVEVRYVDPQKFHDAGLHGTRGAKDVDRTLNELTKHIEKQAERYLKAGQSLKIEVLDVDLAGRVEWWRPNLHDARIMRDIDSPYIKLRYTLIENGQTLASGEERVSDLDYLRSSPWTGRNETLKYEKDMLKDWMRKRFAS